MLSYYFVISICYVHEINTLLMNNLHNKSLQNLKIMFLGQTVTMFSKV